MFLSTSDGKKISAMVFEVEDPVGWIIYIHMMPSTKESWQKLGLEFKKLKYSGVAVDLRGHGESDSGPSGYENFTDEEHQNSLYDLEAAWEFLKSSGARPDATVLIGASIGANLALKFIAEKPEFKTAVLLSAGFNYKGVETVPLAKSLSPGQKVMLVSSRDDERTAGNNAEQNQALYNVLGEGVIKELKIYDHAGHGTQMLEREPELARLIVEFVNK